MRGERDRELVERALAGDLRAFEELIQAHQRVLFNVALRMVNHRDDALDLTQITFLKAWRRLDTFDPAHRFFSWIYRILVNEALNLLARRRPSEELDDQMRDGNRTPEEGALAVERRAVVEESLMDLNAGERELIVLRHLLHRSHREIAELLGLPEITVKSRLYTARQRLAGILQRRGVTSA